MAEIISYEEINKIIEQARKRIKEEEDRLKFYIERKKESNSLRGAIECEDFIKFSKGVIKSLKKEIKDTEKIKSHLDQFYKELDDIEQIKNNISKEIPSIQKLEYGAYITIILGCLYYCFTKFM